MKTIFSEIINKYYGKKYCSICGYCCEYMKYHNDEKYIFDDDGIIEYYDGYRGLVISPNLGKNLYYCTNCIDTFPHEFNFEVYPYSWKEYYNAFIDENIDYYGSNEWTYEQYYSISV